MPIRTMLPCGEMHWKPWVLKSASVPTYPEMNREKGDNKMNTELLAPCGLYCGVCGVYMASRDNNQKLKDKLANAYGVTPEQIACKGCLSNEKFVYCQTCGIRSCVMEKIMKAAINVKSFLVN